MALPMINCQSFIISQKLFSYIYLIVLFIQSLHGFKKNLHPAATPSLPLTTASQTDQRNTAKKKMRPVPQKTGCVHKRGEIPLSVMHMLVVT